MREFLASLKALDAEAGKALRVEFKEAAEIVAADARRRAPKRSGRLQRSIRAYGTQRGAGIREGKASVEYAGYIDFGNKPNVGRAPRHQERSHAYPFIKTGRIMYPAYYANRDRVRAMVGDALFRVARKVGLEVSVRGR